MILQSFATGGQNPESRRPALRPTGVAFLRPKRPFLGKQARVSGSGMLDESQFRLVPQKFRIPAILALRSQPLKRNPPVSQ
jgi:hypothetical protein